jgi:ubiquinone/menaquinone biosynthesis C-methylase UbiE
MQELMRKFAEWPGGMILDVATGHGGFIPHLREFFPGYRFIVGVDISSRAIDDVHRMYAATNKIEFAMMDAGELALKRDSIETAAITNSLHHLRDADLALQEMKRVLRPGGLFLIFEMFKDGQNEMQNSHVRIHHWWAEIDRLNGYLHNETFTKRQIIKIAERIGLRKLEYIELSDPEPVNQAVVDRIQSTCDDYLAKIDGRPGCEQLRQRGIILKQRIDETGFAWAKSLCAAGYK